MRMPCARNGDGIKHPINLIFHSATSDDGQAPGTSGCGAPLSDGQRKEGEPHSPEDEARKCRECAFGVVGVGVRKETCLLLLLWASPRPKR